MSIVKLVCVGRSQENKIEVDPQKLVTCYSKKTLFLISLRTSEYAFNLHTLKLDKISSSLYPAPSKGQGGQGIKFAQTSLSHLNSDFINTESIF